MARKPTVRWKTYRGADATPPADAGEWVEIIATISTILVVEFVSREDRHWWCSKATETKAQPMGDGPSQGVRERRQEVVEALRKAGKPIVD